MANTYSNFAQAHSPNLTSEMLFQQSAAENRLAMLLKIFPSHKSDHEVCS